MSVATSLYSTIGYHSNSRVYRLHMTQYNNAYNTKSWRVDSVAEYDENKKWTNYTFMPVNKHLLAATLHCC